MGRPKNKAYVPAFPLGEAVMRMAATSSFGVVCQRAGVPERVVSRWRRYEQGDLVDLDLADQVLTRLGLFWWDVWTPESVREPLFVVVMYHHEWKKAPTGVYKLRRLRDRSIPYGDLGTDYYRLREIETLMSGQLQVAA